MDTGRTDGAVAKGHSDSKPIVRNVDSIYSCQQPARQFAPVSFLPEPFESGLMSARRLDTCAASRKE